MTRVIAGNGCYIACIALLGVVIVTTESAADVRAQRDQWKVNEGGCLTLADKPEMAESIRRLAMVLVGKYESSVGCVTFPYLGTPYDIPQIKNAAHAGIDLRANGVPVLAAEAGSVVERAFDQENERSTLIIENNGRSRKTLYLHMSSIDVEKGDYVLAGQQVGTAGAVGTASAHLHFEVWPAYSPIYCTRERSVSGSACPQDGGTCSVASIEHYTIEPEVLIRYPDNTARPKRAEPSVSSADTLTLSGIGPVKVGATLWESLKGLDELVIGDDSADCDMVKLQSADCGLWVMVSRGRVLRIDIDQGNYRTADGIGIGTTEAELRMVYGARLQRRSNQYTEGAEDLWVDGTVSGNARSVLFEVEGGKVTRFRAGEANAVGWVEGCN